ncbi:MAG TPA: tetratricopeptide repeat protein, partial [Bacteroidota bacterium]|nr:tetratricopeptide repeat protein [Bacteroidota bacterium]
QRFQSAGELLQALRGDRQAISKMLRRRTTRTATRYWWLAAVIGVLLLAYLIVPIGSEHQELPSVAVLYLKNLGPPEDEALSYGITNALIVDLARAGWLHVTPIKDILSLKDAALSSGEIAKQFDVRHLVEGSIFRQGDEFTVSAQLLEASTKKQLWGYHLALSKSELATLEGNMALAILKALRVSPSPQAKKEIGARRSENPEAYEYYLKGRYRFDNKKSKEDVVLAQGFFEKARALDPGMLLAFLGLGEIHVFTGENEKARQLYTEALTIAKTHGERSMEAAANRGLGNLFSDRGEYPEALAYYTLGHTIVHEIGDSLEEANILHDIGLVYGNQSNYQTSLDFYRRSLRLAQALGDDHGQAQTLSKIGQVFYSQSDFPEALSHYTLALKFAGKVGDHVLESRILNGIANIYEGEGDYYNALNVYRRNLETIRLLGDRRGEGITCINLGLISYDLGDFGPALEFYERADTIFTELGNRRNLGLTWTNIAMVLDEEKEYSRALDYYTRGISTASEIGDTANATMRSHFLGISYFRQKNFRRAIDNFRTAEAIFYRMQDTIAAINSSVWLALALNRTGKEAEVRATANTIDTLLNAYSELDDPVGVYWNMSQIFSALHDSSRARRYLVKAFTIIRERRDKIPDEKLRKSFLSNITVNRDVMNAWNSSPGHN